MEENTNVTAAEAEKTYTEKDLQSYADKRVTEALKTAKSKFEAEKKEAERLASMTAEERFTEELNKRESELAERERQVTLLENKAAAASALNEKGISISLVDLVLADTAEEMKTKIDTLEKEFNASVQAEIEKRLKGATPKSVSSTGEISKEDIKKMSLAEQQAFFNSHPEEYRKIYN